MPLDKIVTIESPHGYQGGDIIVTSIQGVIDSSGLDAQSLTDHFQFEVMQIINRLKPQISNYDLTKLEGVELYETALVDFKRSLLVGIETSNIESDEVRHQFRQLLVTCLEDGFRLCEHKRQLLGGSATKIAI